jgi:ribosome-associated translation inhibitor RaiA
MKMQIVTKNLTVSDSHKDRIERRLYFALGRFSTGIVSVEILLQDENGPRGGVDKRCRIIVRLRASDDVIVEGRGQETTSLIDRTAARAGRAVSRSFNSRKRGMATRGSGEYGRGRD